MNQIDYKLHYGALENVALPQQTSKLIGHEPQYKTFLQNLQSNAIHHAWIVHGEVGIGKATFCFNLARRLLSQPQAIERNQDSLEAVEDTPVDQHTAAMIANGAHPNLLYLTRPYNEKTKGFKNAITIDEVRKIRGFLEKTAGEGDWRILIIDPADDMNLNAANGILKLLEEPPGNSLFFLVSHRPNRLLPTIHSRCSKLRLNSLSDTQIDDVLKYALLDYKEHDPRDLEKATASSAGSARKAILMLEDESLEILKNFQSLMQDWPCIDRVKVIELSDTLSIKAKDRHFKQMQDLCLDWVHNRMITALDGQNQQATTHDNLNRLNSWSDIWISIQKQFNACDIYNLDKKQTLIECFDLMSKINRR